HEQGDRVGADRGTDGAAGNRHPDHRTECAVRDGLAVAEFSNSVPDGELERAAAERYRHTECGTAAVEVAFELGAGALEHAVRCVFARVVGELTVGLDRE